VLGSVLDEIVFTSSKRLQPTVYSLFATFKAWQMYPKRDSDSRIARLLQRTRATITARHNSELVGVLLGNIRLHIHLHPVHHRYWRCARIRTQGHRTQVTADVARISWRPKPYNDRHVVQSSCRAVLRGVRTVATGWADRMRSLSMRAIRRSLYMNCYVRAARHLREKHLR
jgi:hypothetical protein